VDQPVVRRRQELFPGDGPVLDFIDKGGGMLDPHPHGKGLLLHEHPPPQQHFTGIPGRMARRQHHRVGLMGVTGGGNHSPHRAAADYQVVDPGIETNVRTQGKKSIAQRPHHRRQPVGAQMRLLLIEYALRGAALGQGREYPGYLRPAGAGGELPVRIGAGPSLAEKHIAFGVEEPFRLKSAYMGHPFFHLKAPLQEQHPYPGPAQPEGAEEPGRAGPHNDYPPSGTASLWRHRRGLLPPHRYSFALKQGLRRIVGDLGDDPVPIHNAVFMAGIQGLQHDAPRRGLFDIVGFCQFIGNSAIIHSGAQAYVIKNQFQTFSSFSRPQKRVDITAPMGYHILNYALP